ncbi:superfamily I DNA/RNA helicase [Rarobacter incanus]|uniref:DNA 3'-5' helicase n=2 Tax=Rarobacter incanus TaxID=153494 RepID=A0A542SNG6_9MICO|nr:superfamily I DNA/RNA helicase [Rarobacter incanus]
MPEGKDEVPAHPRLDSQQDAVVAAVATGRHIVVTGAPGTGKTTLALHIVTDAIASGVDADRVVLLTASRGSAARLRDRVTAAGGGTRRTAAVRSAASLAFAILSNDARMNGRPAPVLTTGPEQDREIAELLAGHLAGMGVDVPWPAAIPPETLGLAGFRSELRDLMMRCAERAIAPADLERLGREHDEPAWIAAAALYREYENVNELARMTPDRGDRFDSAGIVAQAAVVAERLRVQDAPGRLRFSLVVVDEYQDASAATAQLLAALAADGAQLVLLSDPDQAVQGFRGSRPDLARLAATPPSPRSLEVGQFDALPFVLTTAHRTAPEVTRAIAGIAQSIGTAAGTRHRFAGGPSGDPGAGAAVEDDHDSPDAEAGPSVGEYRPRLVDPVARWHLRSFNDEMAWAAWMVRWRHYTQQVPWSRCAVIVRSGAQAAAFAGALQRAGVPAVTGGADRALRAEPAVRALCEIVQRTRAQDWDEASLLAVLSSPYFDLDPVAVRAVRRIAAQLTAKLCADDEGGRHPLLTCLTRPGGLRGLRDSSIGGTPLAAAMYRLAAMISAARDTADETNPGTVLWAVWDASKCAQRWQQAALRGGPHAAQAHAQLDALMTLFKKADTFTERAALATIDQFVEQIRSFDIPADTLAATGQRRDVVEVLTPAQATGRQWSFVIVSGLQYGVWPDLRLRDSLLGAQRLADLVDGRVGASDVRGQRRAVLDDELRLFLVAVSRATQCVHVTAVSSDDDQPSAMCDLVAPPPAGPPIAAPPPLDLRGLALRARVAGAAALAQEGGSANATAWVELLGRLAGSGVREAQPQTWYGIQPVSTVAPLHSADEVVAVSPSRIALAHACSLRWAGEMLGAVPSGTFSTHLGTLIHEIAKDHPAASAASLAAELHRRWPDLGLVDGWPSMQSEQEARAMVAKLAQFEADNPAPRAVERAIDVEVAGVRVRGSIDRIDSRGARPLITDFKTGKVAASQADAEVDPQLAAYQVAYDKGHAGTADADAGPQAVRSADCAARDSLAGAQLVYLGAPTKSVSIRTQRALADFPDPSWAERMIAQAGSIMAAGQLWARPGAVCRSCPIRTSCPVMDQGRQLTDVPGTDDRANRAPHSEFGSADDRRAQAGLVASAERKLEDDAHE